MKSDPKLIKITLFLFGVLMFPLFVLASITDGTIDATYKYGWSENAGWVNFGCSNCNVHITDSRLTGYVWSENYGWINLNPATSGVKNDGEGNLSGYAWGENLGWINFSGVIINSSGEFSGFASGDISGQISFNCTNCKVRTDWRPLSARPSAPLGGQIILPPKPPEPEPEKPPLIDALVKEAQRITERIRNLAREIARIFPPIRPPIVEEIKPPEVPIEELVPKEAPLAFQGKWQLLPSEPIRQFVLSPLPKEIQRLAGKFPELEQTLEKVGISKITDISRLRTITLKLPGLTERIGLPVTRVESGKFALPQGVPVAQLSAELKQAIPSEIVFAKTGGELIDFNIALSVSEKGETQQKITTISGKPLQLVVKPDKPVKSVKGYVVFKSKTPRPTSFQFPFNQLMASIIFANPVFAKPQEQPVRVEEKLVLLEFEYTDPDGDGIYTAEIQAPIVEGEYEIITVIEYEDPELGKRAIRLITVVDPEGYVYTTLPAGKLRIAGAIVSIYWLNSEIKQYELWPAKEYQQENPQTTDDTGKYSFLVPPGTYYLRVEHPNYPVYQSETFIVKEGSGIHMNIELKTKFRWLKIIDWKIAIIILFGILLAYNFYRDKIREKLLRKSKTYE